MKAIKLKPLFFPSDDILVQPPDIVLNRSSTIVSAINPSKSLSPMKNLMTILRGRQLKKLNAQKKPDVEVEKEAVQRLSEWKTLASPNKSPLMRKFTFRRTFTLGQDSKSPPKIAQSMVNMKIGKIALIDALVSKVQKIIVHERNKKKVQEEEIKEISERNQRYEQEAKSSIKRLSHEIKSLKAKIRENTSKLDDLRAEFVAYNKKYEEDCAALSLMEAQELLFRDKDKGKKPVKINDEKQYFIKKERFRKMKQELHKNYQEGKDRYTILIEEGTRFLDSSIHLRQISKKELKEYREQTIMLYCRTLRDGKDIRADGLRWIIKGLWLMNEPVPISAFPKFLDDESAHFLLVVAEKDIELDVYEKKLDELRTEVKNKRPSSALPSAKNLYNDVRKRLRDISQSSVGHGEKEIYPMNTESTKNGFSKVNSSNFNDISELRTKVAGIHEFVKESMTQEIKRVTDLYQINSGKAEELGLFHVIRCLVGDKVREFNKYTRITNNGKARGSILLN